MKAGIGCRSSFTGPPADWLVVAISHRLPPTSMSCRPWRNCVGSRFLAPITSDGVSFAAQLKDPDAPAHRDHLVVQFQGGAYFRAAPKAWEYSCVLKDRWRLIDGKELYDLDQDPAQRNDISAAHPRVVEELRALYPAFWNSVSPRMTPVSIDLGNPADNPTTLCSQDWYMPTGNPPWNFGSIKKLPRVTGPWMVDVKKAGRYRLTLRQWPIEADKPVKAVRAKIQISGQEMEAAVEPESKGVVFELELPAGKTELRTFFTTRPAKRAAPISRRLRRFCLKDELHARFAVLSRMLPHLFAKKTAMCSS